MRIKDLLLKGYVIDKLAWKHNISELELRQVFNNEPKIRMIEKGKIKGRRESIPKEFATLEAAAEFWDKHDLADYWKDTKEVKVDVKVPPTPRYIPLEKEIAKFIAKIARDQHITPETLVNLWLKERLIRTAKNKSSIWVT